MALPSVTTGSLGAHPTVVLRAGGDSLEIALRGATPLRWLVPGRGGSADLLDGYRDAAELEAEDGVRNGIMAPFCNRVAGAGYVFAGVEHDLLPGAVDRTIYHGLVRSLPFTVRDSGSDDDVAWVTLRCDALADGRWPGYPFAVEVEVTYRVRPGSIEIEIVGHNRDATAAPFSAGWHPYFRLPGAATVDRLELGLQAAVAIRTDADLIPRPGGAAYAPLAVDVRWAPLGGAVIDACFAGAPDRAGTIRSVLRDPVTGAQLVVWQDRGLTHVFTGDTVARDRRASLALEPVEVMTDAFNRADCAAAIRLEPGQRRAFRCGVTFTGPPGQVVSKM